MELFYCNMTTFWVVPELCIDLEMVPDLLLQSACAEVVDRYGWVVIQQFLPASTLELRATIGAQYIKE